MGRSLYRYVDSRSALDRLVSLALLLDSAEFGQGVRGRAADDMLPLTQFSTASEVLGAVHRNAALIDLYSDIEMKSSE